MLAWLCTARTSIATSPNTQWCDQEIGEISSAAKALSDNAQALADRASACRMPRQARTPATADSASHAAVPAAECGTTPARASTPAMDWLAAQCGLPGRSAWTMTEVQ